MLKKPEFFQSGFHLTYFPMGDEVREWVERDNWKAVDNEFKKLTAPGGRLFRTLLQYHDFTSIEFIISVRDSQSPDEEDGVWHDDGSRVFAFSLSLTLDSDAVAGGRLGIRRKGDTNYIDIPTPSFGGMILFLTGIYSFEHKIHRVTKGRRVIIAGWCS